MGIIFETEVSNDGIVKVLQHVQQYLPSVDEGEKLQLAEQGIVGGQLTIERAVNAVKSMANGYTPLDCLDCFHIGIADWHSGVKFLSVSEILINNIFIYIIQIHSFITGHFC